MVFIVVISDNYMVIPAQEKKGFESNVLKMCSELSNRIVDGENKYTTIKISGYI